MTSRDFCYWLQGWFELHGKKWSDNNLELSTAQIMTIKNHLAMVFKHEIDPGFGDKAKQEALSKIHSGSGLSETLFNC